MLDGQNSGDTYNVTQSALGGPLTVSDSGASGMDQLTSTTASAVAETIGVSSTQVTRTGSKPITYSGLESLTVVGTPLADTINVASTAAATATTINADPLSTDLGTDVFGPIDLTTIGTAGSNPQRRRRWRSARAQHHRGRHGCNFQFGRAAQRKRADHVSGNFHINRERHERRRRFQHRIDIGRRVNHGQRRGGERRHHLGQRRFAGWFLGSADHSRRSERRHAHHVAHQRLDHQHAARGRYVALRRQRLGGRTALHAEPRHVHAHRVLPQLLSMARKPSCSMPARRPTRSIFRTRCRR